MITLITSNIGRLRIIAFMEGLSLLVLVFVAVPFKYLLHDGRLTQLVGPVHGVLFLLFVVNCLSVGLEYHWKFRTTTWKVLLACIIPFGTFYIDRTLLSKMK